MLNSTSLAGDDTVHGGLRSLVLGFSGLLVTNNLFWNNDGRDACLSEQSGEGCLYHNNNADYFGSVGVVASNFGTESTVDSGVLNFVPTFASGEVNQGSNPPVFIPQPPPFNAQCHTGSRDFYGNSRITDSRVDVGACEAAAEVPIFKTGFESN